MSVAGEGSAEQSGAPAPAPAPVSDEEARRASVFTLWSWLMLPALIVSFGVGYAVGTMFMATLDVPQGELLTTAGVAGRLAAVLVLVIGVIPPVLGVLLARSAVRRGGTGGAKAALIVNAVVLVYLVAVQVLQQITT